MTLRDLLTHVSSFALMRVMWVNSETATEWRMDGDRDSVLRECMSVLDKNVDTIHHSKRRIIVTLT